MKKYDCVLLIDDNIVTNYINKTIINHLKIADKVEITSNGEDAIQFINSYGLLNEGLCPDVILVDIRMPVADGFAFLERYSNLNFKNKDKVKVIILSSSDNMQDLDQSFKYQLDGYIVKPLTGKKILSLIEH